MEQRLVKLLSCYEELEKQFPVADDVKKYSLLVTASGNRQPPVQRWFRFKEGYSLDLLETLISDWKIKSSTIQRVLDPFSGTGTSLLATQKLAKKLGRKDLEAIGIECNPLLRFVSQTKSGWHTFDASKFKESATHLLNEAERLTPCYLPELSTFQREDIFTKQQLVEILSHRDGIESVPGREKALLLLGYANVLEDLSGIRKDGRMIRLVENKQRPTTVAALTGAWSIIADDIDVAHQHFSPIDTSVHLGDGRTLATTEVGKQLGGFDLIIYSPPYLNNIDYTEVYKIELWLCGFVNTRESFNLLRHQTFRSHPSVKFLAPITITSDRKMKKIIHLLDTLTNALPDDEDRSWRTQLFKGYFDDVYQSLERQQKVLQEGSWIFCVVGNSLHGSDSDPDARVPVASDLIIASIAQAIGLQVKGIQVARHLKRRGPDGHLLRESIVAMRKPKRRQKIGC